MKNPKKPNQKDKSTLDPLEEARKEILKAWASFDKVLKARKSTFLGFQANQGLHYQNVIAEYLDCQINNLGDPYLDGSFRINSKEIEKKVPNCYARLWHGEPHDPKNPESCWGYVCSMGSTEANLYGLWNARDYLAGRPLLNPTDAQEIPTEEKDRSKPYLEPVLFYSEDTHYSGVKAAQMLGLKRFCDVGNDQYKKQCVITLCDECERNHRQKGCEKSDCGVWPMTGAPSVDGLVGTGVIDINKLKTLVTFFVDKRHPIIINFNYGTAFKGAYDDIEEAERELLPIFEERKMLSRRVQYRHNGKDYTDIRTGYWFHVDGALGAAYMPFIAAARDLGLYDKSVHVPKFDFALKSVHSISMSGHKWIGAPWPCAIYMTRRKYQLEPVSDPAYLGTLAGSRNGLSALILASYIKRTSEQDEVMKATKTQRTADYAYRQLKNLEDELIATGKFETDFLRIRRAPLSLSVYFREVPKEIVDKYSLNKERFMVKIGDTKQEMVYNHIFVMDHVDEALIEKLIEDLRTSFEEN